MSRVKIEVEHEGYVPDDYSILEGKVDDAKKSFMSLV